MTDARVAPTPAPQPHPSLLAADAPSDTFRQLGPRAPAVERPVEMPGVFGQIHAAAINAGAEDERQELLQQQAVDQGYAALADELKRRGFKDDYSFSPLPGAAPMYRGAAIFRDIQRARQLDPHAFAGVEDDPERWRQRIITPLIEADRQRQDIVHRMGWAPWLLGTFIGGASDPLNLATLAMGGGGARSILGAAIKDARTNVQLEAMQAPEHAVERAARGQETTPLGVATDLATAAGTGALLGGGMKALEHPAAALARTARERIGWDRMTDAERGATAVLEREADIAAGSPFTPGAGTDAHAERLNRAIAMLNAPPDVAAPLRPVSSAEAAARTAADRWEQFKLALGRRESSGDDSATNPHSSATGRYQVIDSTWLRVARTFPEAAHASDSYLLALRSHPVWQERVVDQLGAEYRSALAKVGAPETPANLYLMHFAGTGAASKILRAAGDTPVEALLSHAALQANPFLRGKSAEEVVDWAARAIGGERSRAPVLRRDLFAEGDVGDAEWRAAQREVEASDAAWDDWGRDDVRPPTRDPASGVAHLDDDVPFDLDDPRARPVEGAPAETLSSRPLGNGGPDSTHPGALPEIAGRDELSDPLSPDRVSEAAPSRWSLELAELRKEQSGIVRGLLHHEALDAPIDLPWGQAGDPARDYRGGFGLAHILAKHPEMEAHLARLPEMIADMAVWRHEPLRERLELEDARHRAVIALSWHGKDARWLVTAFEKRTPAETLAPRPLGNGGADSTHPGAPPNLGELSQHDKQIALLRSMWATDAARGDIPKPVWALRDEHGKIAWWSPSKRAAERTAIDMPGAWELTRLEPHDVDVGPPPDVAGFDHPDDVAVARQIDSLEHDARMALAADPELMVPLGEGEKPVRLADALRDCDDDAAAVDAARACLAPPTSDNAKEQG
ncbi:hypothetical protein [Sphingomonas sp. BK235]|uniref:putative barnase/colicin E5 family endoribonuclease n=1 Tax=Sphingomonas sp. BK235 TaxID=2512131 RepID=UPI0010519C2A|nr:hypothetical protein [Sphingomonas sp. BK235]TCP35917.1 hypothetical protein EV292_102507 [Sphingomonas sp. BK235]